MHIRWLFKNNILSSLLIKFEITDDPKSISSVEKMLHFL